MSTLCFEYEVNVRFTRFLLAILIVILLITSQVYAAVAGQEVSQANALFQQLNRQTGASEIARVARAVGPIIDATRRGKVSVHELKALRDILSGMRKQTQQRVTDIEHGAQQSEAALERLYRSQSWDDLSFSQAAFAYWRAWIDLELARRTDNQGSKNRDLLEALKGFRVASMQLFRPELIYGGWLGIGYVEMERGHHDRARQIFQRLDEVLATAPESPIREAVSLELRLLEIRTGQVRAAARINRNIDENEAKILHIEAFALLEQSRKTGSQPTGAGRRLKALIESGRMDQSMLNNMMNYAQEIAGLDVGPWRDLAAAEFRLRHKDYEKSMRKFQVFFRQGVAPPGVDLNYYRYRWAVAAYEAGVYQSAVNVLESLVRKKNLTPEIDKAASKLLYAVYAAREVNGGSSANRKLLQIAAQRFVRINPNDPDVDSARLVVAQTSLNSNTALKVLNQIHTKSKLGGNVERTAFQVIARDFSDKIALGKTEPAASLARQGINAFQELPDSDKRDSLNVAIQLQMRALVDPKINEVLESIDLIVVNENTNLDIRRALIWSRLQLYDRLDEPVRIIDFMRSLSASEISGWQLNILYPWIAERKDVNLRMELAKILRPYAKGQPDMDRRIRSLIINDLITMENNGIAYEEARAFTQEYSNSGDAWRLLARSAELYSKPFEADHAWSIITDKAVPTMGVWWEGMLSRVRIRNHSTRPEQACPLLQNIERSSEHLPVEHKAAYELAIAESRC
jgi:hypothetical protein